MVLYAIPLPEPVNCSGDIASNWKVFREAYKDYAIAMQVTEKVASIQVATLKSVMGMECKQILKRLELTEEQPMVTSS